MLSSGARSSIMTHRLHPSALAAGLLEISPALQRSTTPISITEFMNIWKCKLQFCHALFLPWRKRINIFESPALPTADVRFRPRTVSEPGWGAKNVPTVTSLPPQKYTNDQTGAEVWFLIVACRATRFPCFELSLLPNAPPRLKEDSFLHFSSVSFFCLFF